MKSDFLTAFMVIIFSLIAIGSWSKVLEAWLGKSSTSKAPQFLVGECIVNNIEVEVWEDSNPTLRIIQKGKRAYAVCTFEAQCREVLEGGARPKTLPYSELKDYSLVDCR